MQGDDMQIILSKNDHQDEFLFFVTIPC